MKAVIVIPTYNERENIKRIVPAILEYVPDVKILIVDDSSPDGTGQLVDEMAAQIDNVSVLHRDGPRGLGSAYRAGFKHALENMDVDCIFEMDADFSHDPKYLPQFLEAIEECDLVIGSRYLKGISVVNWPLNRLCISKFGVWYARIITRVPVTDATAGFKCFRREVLESLDLDKIHSNGYAFQIEINYYTWLNAYRIKEIPIIFVEREEGQSKMSLKIVSEAVWRVWWLVLKNLFRKKSAAAR